MPQHFLSHSHHFFPLLTPVILQNFHYLLFLYTASISGKFSHSVMSASLQPHGLKHTCQASLDFTESRSLLKLMSIESMMPFNHLILCLPLLPLPSCFPASGSFQMSQLFTADGQRIGVSASAAVLWRRKWQPTPVFLPGGSQGRGTHLVGCRLWGRTESDTTEVT